MVDFNFDPRTAISRAFDAVKNAFRVVVVDPVLAIITGGENLKIYNVSMPLSTNEYSQALSAGTKQIIVSCRELATIYLAFNTGETSTLFYTINKGATLALDQLTLTGKTIYFKSDKNGVTLEIIEIS